MSSELPTKESSLASADGESLGTQNAGEALAEPSFLHPSSILFQILKSARQLVFPTVVGLWGASTGGMWGLWFAGLAFVLAIFYAIFQYFTLRYSIQGSEFVLKEGLIFRRVRSVPLKRIQNVDLVQNLLHRMFGVAEVNIETASGTKPEATLRVLTKSQIAVLREAIFGNADEFEDTTGFAETSAERADALQSGEAGSATVGAADLVTAAASNRKPLAIFSMPTILLIKAGLASNRGTVLIGVVVGLYFQFQDFGIDLDDVEGFAQVPELSRWQMALFALVGVIAVVLLLRLLSIAWYLQRFYGYSLTRIGEDLRISCGLFTKVSATVPRKRIQFISVHRSLIMRWFGLASIRIETAGGAGDEGENASATVSRRWFLPVVPEDQVWAILRELRPQVNWREEMEDVEWHGVSPRTNKRLMRIAVLQSILLAAVGLGVTRPWGFLAGVVVLPLLVLFARRKAKSKRYMQQGWGIGYQSGLFNKKMSFAFYDRMQNLRLSQSPFDRRWGMAVLEVDTAAAGPADHAIVMRYLDETFAKKHYQILKDLSAKHRPSWA